MSTDPTYRNSPISAERTRGRSEMTEELFARLKRAFLAKDWDSCWSALNDFKAAGGAQGTAYITLERLRDVEGVDEDDVLDVMDVVCGYVRPESKIWPGSVRPGDPTTWRTISGVLLRVTGYQMHNGRLGLLPGISQKSIQEQHLPAVGQGTVVELRTPDGLFHATCIVDYFVQVAKGDASQMKPSELPIIICLPCGFTPVNAPLGTELRLAEFL